VVVASASEALPAVEQHLGIVEAAAVTIETGLAQQPIRQSGLAGAVVPDDRMLSDPAQEVNPGEGLDLRLGDPWLTANEQVSTTSAMADALAGGDRRGCVPAATRLPD